MERVPRADHTIVGPVFVLGCVRSGTSLTCRLLLDHLGVNFGTESQFIVRYYQRLGAYGDLRKAAAMRRLLTDLSRERFFTRTHRNFGFVFDIDRALQSIDDPSYAGALRAIFEQFAAQKGMVRWGDKTPEYSRRLDVLHDLFPSAQFVHVVRDAREVTLSAFKMPFGPKSAYEAAVYWRDTVNRIQNFGARLPAGQYMEFRYEALVDDPLDTLHRVASFLGIVNHGALLDGKADCLRAQVRRNPVKWKTGLGAGDVGCIETVAGPELARLGYEFQAPSRELRKLGAVQVAMWRAQGIYRRTLNRAYWADSAYRLGLRLRDLSPWLRPGRRGRRPAARAAAALGLGPSGQGDKAAMALPLLRRGR